MLFTKPMVTTKITSPLKVTAAITPSSSIPTSDGFVRAINATTNVCVDNGLATVNAREVIAWTLAATATVLFIGLLTVNITVLVTLRKRRDKESDIQALQLKQSVDIGHKESNVYEK